MKPKPIFLTSLCALVLVAGVYAIINTSGNTEVQSNSASTAASCELSVTRGKSLDKFATGDVAAFRPLEQPLDMSNISFADANMNQKTLADWKGKLILFNLWATWCPPCREEMPYFETLQKEKGGETFEVVPVSIDLGDDVKPKKFYADTGLQELSFFHDNTMEAFQGLKEKAVALGMPTTLLVDTNGCGLGVLNGPAHWAGTDAITLVDAALALPKIN